MGNEIYLIGIWILLIVILVDAFLLPKKLSASKRFRANQAKRYLLTFRSIQEPSKKFGYLRKVNPYAFEEMINESLKQRELLIKRTQTYSGDGGIDGVFYIRDQKFFVQAKRYKSHINPEHVNSFKDICRKNKVKGIFVHTGKTGAKSKDIGNGNICFISGVQLLNLFDGHTVILTFSDQTFSI
jgi:restriction system protein